MDVSNPGSDRSSRKVVQADFPGWEGAGVDLCSDFSGRGEFAPLGGGFNGLKSQTAEPQTQTAAALTLHAAAAT